MLIGISGLVNGDWRAIDANVLRNVRGMGFAVLQVRVDDPRDLDPASVRSPEAAVRRARRCDGADGG